MKDLWHHSKWSFMATFAKMATNLVVGKLFSVYFGTAGITLLTHFQNLIALFTQIPNDGINRGLIKYWSEPSVDHHSRSAYFIAAVLLHILIFIASATVLFLFREEMMNIFLRQWRKAHSLFYILLFTGTFVFIGHLLFHSMMLAIKQFKIYAITTFIQFFIVTSAVLLLKSNESTTLVLIAFLMAQCAVIIFSGGYIYYKNLVSFNINIDFNKIKNLAHFALMALSVLLFTKLTDFILRAYVIDALGAHKTGLWQSVVRLSDGYQMLFVSMAGIVVYPHMASLVHDKWKMKSYIKAILKRLVPILMIGLLMVYLVKDFIFQLLFSSEFIPAGNLMPFQIAGDFLNMISYLFVYIISVQARTFTFIGLQAFSAFVFILAAFFLLPFYGIEALPISHFIRYVAFLTVLILANKKLFFN